MNALCRHFGACGGCSLQHLAPDAYVESKRALILDALARHGISRPPLLEIVSVPPRSRRRATLELQKRECPARIGFHAPRSHELIDIQECQVLTPGLFQLAQALRDLLGPALISGENMDLNMLEAENGFDVSIRCQRKMEPPLVARIASIAPGLGLLRATAGEELLYQSGVPVVTLGKAAVSVPPNAFLQPTREGERSLQVQVATAVGKVKKLADIFSGCGTFSLPVAETAQVHAVDANRSMLEALSRAARTASGLKPMTIEARDLFRQPLTPAELKGFDAVVLDPPRAGALAQARQLARSGVSRIAYVSCDAASFARDARLLVDGSFRLDTILGVDQFLWSAHIELVAAFSR